MLAQLDRWLRELRGIDPGTLSPAVRADRAMLENEFLADALVADGAARVAVEPVRSTTSRSRSRCCAT